ncbi:MAG: SUMF1/EgtB/PvdO family nonheme iron enzyme [Candidatus Sumerlaeia bacterium]|nr:SUMF1/EgtB/PvdO family nonheme iron enzyme [Candidatus Sumerlaeia bacterium]
MFHLAEGVELRAVRVEPGAFAMGSPWTELGRNENEGPVTTVRFTKPFRLGETEVTQAQWEALGFENLSEWRGADLPVGNVSRFDAEAWCAAASTKLGVVVRLPTEAEWEYAARAGSGTAYPCGERDDCLDGFAWHQGNSGGELRAVRRWRPNAWGLHDMTGNAMEWCANGYGAYPGGELVDWKMDPGGALGVLRPGVFWVDNFMLRTACRSFWPAEARDRYFGFRVLIEEPAGLLHVEQLDLEP